MVKWNGGGVGSGSNGPNIRIFRNGQPVNVLQKPAPIIKTIEITLTGLSRVQLSLEIERWIKQMAIKITEREKFMLPLRGIDNDEIIILRNKGNISEQLRET